MKQITIYALLLLVVFRVNAQLPSVAFIFAEPGGEYYQVCVDAADDLYATGLFETVDSYNAVTSGGTPSLEDIMTYDAVLVQGNSSFDDNVSLGNDMASYAASGGGVILASYTLAPTDGPFISWLGGEWLNGNWDIVLNHELEFELTDCYDGIGTVYEPDHTVAAHANELEFTNYYSGFQINPPVAEGAVRILDYILGHPIAYASESLANRLDLGIMIQKAPDCYWGSTFGLPNFLADCFYYVSDIGALNNVATLSDLQVDGVTVEGFAAEILTYTVELPEGSAIPVVTATTTDPNAEADITQISEFPGTATIVVTAEDVTTTLTYSIDISINTGINEVNIYNIVSYPNPVIDKINLSSDVKIENVEICTLFGQKVFEQKIMTTTAQIDLSSFMRGTYIMKITTNGQIGVHKITKK